MRRATIINNGGSGETTLLPTLEAKCPTMQSTFDHVARVTSFGSAKERQSWEVQKSKPRITTCNYVVLGGKACEDFKVMGHDSNMMSELDDAATPASNVDFLARWVVKRRGGTFLARTQGSENCPPGYLRSKGGGLVLSFSLRLWHHGSQQRETRPQSQALGPCHFGSGKAF